MSGSPAVPGRSISLDVVDVDRRSPWRAFTGARWFGAEHRGRCVVSAPAQAPNANDGDAGCLGKLRTPRSPT
jgi:hypothetical protein